MIVMGAAIFTVLTVAAYTVYWERRLCAFIQQRVGPNRVGPWGLLQPLADVIKLLLKEDIVPATGDRLIHTLGPIISVTIAFSAFALVPFAKDTVIADVNIGILFGLAATSIGVYGITLSGWASNSKYSLMGGLRSSAQMISYELSMGIAVVSVILMTNFFSSADTGSGMLSMSNIVESQNGLWFMFINPIGFMIFVTCAFAETNRTPFDLVEAEQELVGGFHTEYSSMKFALFFLAEYINVIVASMLIVTLFMGGYMGPGESWIRGQELWSTWWLPVLWGVGWFTFKVFIWVTIFIWVRWTLPRFKYNQLMDLGWKSFLPLSIINLMVVALILFFFIRA